jgi:hypothetical protein
MKHFPKALISFRNLQGGQFGTLDVEATDPHYVQLALGSDFIAVTRDQWLALRGAIDRFFGCEEEAFVVTREGGGVGPVFIEERFEEIEEEEEVVAPPPPPVRPRSTTRRRSVTG